MFSELERKRPAEIVRSTLATAVMPKPVGTHVVRAKTKEACLREVKKLSRRGYVLGASELAQFHSRAGGGYGVKIALAKPLPQPIPGWAKGCALVGSVLIGLSLVGLLVLHAMQSMFAAAAGLPWATILGGLAVIALLAAITPAGRRCCTVVVKVWH